MNSISSQLAQLHSIMVSIKKGGSADPLLWIRAEFTGKVVLLLLKVLLEHIEWHNNRKDS